ncbi:hypothetical protein M9H77_30809 [Catharanthus roseus]|uniref:Uncharacterized protein n=1 Tax=Catharanthus roseus TaxID=4058 RepID=A0ACB9ZYB8_CATRO|nr:hypothetical protein M9H77_30809 [Catharanthus roseus]
MGILVVGLSTQKWGGRTYLANRYIDDFKATKVVNARDFIEKRELCSIQCVHSISAIAALREEVASYVDEKYHLITFAKVYEPVVNLISGPTFWPRTEKPKVLPPKKLKLPGRPKKCRREDPDEEAETSKLTTKRVLRFGRIKSKCGNCGKQGYNMRTCTEKTWSLLMRTDALNVKGWGKTREHETQSLSQVENVEVEQEAGIDTKVKTQVEVEQRARIDTKVKTQVEVEQRARINTQVEVEQAGIETQVET